MYLTINHPHRTAFWMEKYGIYGEDKLNQVIMIDLFICINIQAAIQIMFIIISDGEQSVHIQYTWE